MRAFSRPWVSLAQTVGHSGESGWFRKAGVDVLFQHIPVTGPGFFLGPLTLSRLHQEGDIPSVACVVLPRFSVCWCSERRGRCGSGSGGSHRLPASCVLLRIRHAELPSRGLCSLRDLVFSRKEKGCRRGGRPAPSSMDISISCSPLTGLAPQPNEGHTGGKLTSFLVCVTVLP